MQIVRLPAHNGLLMLRKIALLGFYAFVIVASFMFTDSLIERGLAATLLAAYKFFNP
jgi:hypothetical protein